MESTAPQSPAGLRTTPSWLLNQTASHAARLVSQGFAAHDLRGYHYRLLAALAEGGPASQADLGRRCDIDRSDVVAAINDLADLTGDLPRRCGEHHPRPAARRQRIPQALH
ncbi:MarR family transcriptional regulator, partial [Micromonospora sp. U21]|nr:MarR family transcriptional regulator [Micromonospora sp. U21]